MNPTDLLDTPCPHDGCKLNLVGLNNGWAAPIIEIFKPDKCCPGMLSTQEWRYPIDYELTCGAGHRVGCTQYVSSDEYWRISRLYGGHHERSLFKEIL